VDVGDRFERVADIWAGKLDQEAGYYAFNDAHAMMSFAATGRAGEIAHLRRSMRTAFKGSDFNAAMTRDVGMPLVDGLEAYARNRHAEAIAAIEPVRDTANLFGGSHAQRDLLTLTLIDASIRIGDTRRARHYIAERQVHKPTAWSDRLLARSEGEGRASSRAAVSSRAAFAAPRVPARVTSLQP
ncbi:MAG: tetratricopeptide repeat protein, partial [Burkholderiaceae bacterium]